MNTSEITESIFNTRWTLINQARDPLADPVAARRALEEVILRYRPAILGAIQRQGINPADCEDVCQDFLVDAFLTKTLPRADRNKGRFRTFLIHTLRLFLIDWRRRRGAIKRGNGVTGSIEDLLPGDEAEAALAVLPRMELEFEMEFAWCMHSEVLADLKPRYEARDQEAVFAALTPHILEKEAGLNAETAASLGMDEGALRQALSRLRRRYGEAFLLKAARITDEDEDAKEEMKQLLKLVLAKTRIGQQAAGNA